MLFKLKEKKKSAKQKAVKRQDDVGNVFNINVHSFILFTRTNYEQSSIVSKISINLAKYVKKTYAFFRFQHLKYPIYDHIVYILRNTKNPS